MLDQRDKPVPIDLTLLFFAPKELSKREIELIDALDWYQPDREAHPGRQTIILVSEQKLRSCLREDFEPYALEDIGLKHLRAVDYIDPVLHRWDRDMFYHA
jgi:hypothetical protein